MALKGSAWYSSLSFHSGKSKSNVFHSFFLAFLPFLGPLLRHMEIPRLGVESEL